MFNKENPKTISTDSTSSAGSKSPSFNMISEGTRLKGDVFSEDDIRVSGTIDGEASSKGRVIVTSSGVIEGNIRAKDADLAGKLEGEMFISGKLVLRQSAVINGDIHTKSLLVEEGAKINGVCKMGVETEGDAVNDRKSSQPSEESGSKKEKSLS